MNEQPGQAAMGASLLAAATFEAALNRLLALDPEAPARVAALGGRVAAVELLGLDLTLYLLPGSRDVQVVDAYAGVPGVIVRGSPAGFALLARGEPLRDAGVEIVGDPLLGKALRDLLAGLHIDWEEQLAGVLGDVAAHQIGRAVRGGLGWLGRAHEVLLTNGAEYLHEESRALPAATEVEAFLAAVDDLHEAADRLDARLARLERTAAAHTG